MFSATCTIVSNLYRDGMIKMFNADKVENVYHRWKIKLIHSVSEASVESTEYHFIAITSGCTLIWSDLIS